MSQSPGIDAMHVGICVSDIERSHRFYAEALGFTPIVSIDALGAPFDTLLELPDTVICVRQLQSGGLRIELLGMVEGDTVGPAQRRPMNQLGLTHMTFSVGDLEAVAARVEALGGQVHRETQVTTPHGSMVFCTDPDGTRIELMQPPSA